jgi:membrane-bound ClpP family serine protease
MHYICKACLANQPADVRAGLYGLRRQFALLIVPSMALIAIGLSFVMIELATGHSWILTIASMAFLLPGVVATIKLATWDQATFRARISTIALSPPRDQDLVV